MKKNFISQAICALAFVGLATPAYSFDIPSAISKGAKMLQEAKAAKDAAPAMGFNESCNTWSSYAHFSALSQQNAQWASSAVMLCNSEYTTYFSPVTKTPLVSIEILGAGKSTAVTNRTDDFRTDPRVPSHAQAQMKDYVGTKFDRGHLAPAADMSTLQAMSESFFLTNIAPQVGANMNRGASGQAGDRGIWADLETATRAIAAKDSAPVIVFTGPVFSQNPQRMGASEVFIPQAFFKFIYHSSSGRYHAYVMPNVQIKTRKTKVIDEGNPRYPQTTAAAMIDCGSVCTTESFKVDIKQLEAVTGWKFSK